MEEGTGDPPKLRRNDRDKKQIRKSLTYYRNLREMKNKRSEYKEKHKIYDLESNPKSPATSDLT
jgi:hypothetical protein